MGIYDRAAWAVIIGLALMLVGGLMLWAYGARQDRRAGIVLVTSGPEAEATQRFHIRLVSWFLVYGVLITAIGGVMLAWAATVLM